MILVLVYNYKTKNEPYVNGFVHMRVLSYMEANLETEVFVLNKRKSKGDYSFDGVSIHVGYIDELQSFIEHNRIDTICIHFLDWTMIEALNQIQQRLRLLIFVHGVEALYWYERIFPDMFVGVRSYLQFGRYIMNNYMDMHNIRKFLNKTGHALELITVSEWMKNIAVKNWKCINRKWNLIPNYINTKLFHYEKKGLDQRYCFLSIRPFFNGKYANDITANVIIKLSLYEEFHRMKFLIVGEGKLFQKLTAPLLQFENVILKNSFLQQEEIADIHKQYGIFLCPTRQDAQGVSMCEAMSSGLVPITLNNTAIPEFIPADTGLACNYPDDMVEKILQLVREPHLFEEYSQKVSTFIQGKCGMEQTTRKEMELLVR